MSTNYGRINCKEAVWNKGEKIPGKNPDVYRRDAYGNTLYYSSHGKYSDMGWHINHIKPISKGGSNKLRNLQPLQSHTNVALGGSLVKKSVGKRK